VVLTPFKIAENDTQPCTLGPEVHGCVSFLAIMNRLIRAAGGNLHGTPSKPPLPVSIRPDPTIK
jgi:hypothetical protein